MSAVLKGFLWITQVTQQVFRGGIWQVYAFLYQRANSKKQKKQKKGRKQTTWADQKSQKSRQAGWEEIQKISRKLSDQWRACGLGVKRLAMEEFYRWMVQWFNPQKSQRHR